MLFEWKSRFKAGHYSFDGDKRPQRSTTSKTDESVKQIGKLIQEDHGLTTQELADKVSIIESAVIELESVIQIALNGTCYAL